jgi:hypothetical protein
MDRPDGDLVRIDGEPNPEYRAGAKDNLCYNIEHNGSPVSGIRTTLPELRATSTDYPRLANSIGYPS